MKQETTKEIGVRVTIILLAGSVGFVASPFARKIWDIAADVALPRLSNTEHLSLVATLSILCLLLGSLLYPAYSKKLLIRDYAPSKPGTTNLIGLYFHKVTKEAVCGSCLHRGIVSPIANTKSNDLICPSCQTTFRAYEYAA